MNLELGRAQPRMPRSFERKVALGCDYNPEQWDRDTWLEDIALMKEIGLDIVAVNVFGWAGLQPGPGAFRFDQLEDVLDLLYASGIDVNLGTGTASPPAWLSRRYPEILPIAADGTTRGFGGRQAFCPSSDVFAEHAITLVSAIAERFGDHPAVAMWHVSNELGGHNAHCYCPASDRAFRRWLQSKYGDLDELNRAWGTAFWSQHYAEWDEIDTPRLTLSMPNPTQVMDFKRFSSDELLRLFDLEAAIIRTWSDVPVTTNLMVSHHFNDIDYWSWRSRVDVVANDHYVSPHLSDPRGERALAADITRGLAHGAPWLLMEQAVGAVNWQGVNKARAAGELLRDSLAHVARGADGICFFQWRASVQGAEKFHSALVPHAGTKSSAWGEVTALAQTLRAVSCVAGATVESHVAMLFSWEAWWGTEGEGLPTTDLSYHAEVQRIHRLLTEMGVTVSVVPPGGDLTGYRLIVVPCMYLIDDEASARVEAAVRGGASVLVTFFSGIVDERDRVREGGYPGAWRELLGIRVFEFCPLGADSVPLRSGGVASVWSERSEVTSAEVIDSFADGPAAGHAAVTRKRAPQSGYGDAWYFSTALDDATARRLLARVVRHAGVARLPGAGPGVEVTRRTGDKGRFLFVINHGPDVVKVDVEGDELITSGLVESELLVPSGQTRVVRERSTSAVHASGDAGY